MIPSRHFLFGTDAMIDGSWSREIGKWGTWRSTIWATALKRHITIRAMAHHLFEHEVDRYVRPNYFGSPKLHCKSPLSRCSHLLCRVVQSLSSLPSTIVLPPATTCRSMAVRIQVAMRSWLILAIQCQHQEANIHLAASSLRIHTC